MRRVLCSLTVNPQYTEFALPQLKSLLTRLPIPIEVLLQQELKGKQFHHPHQINHQLFTHFPLVTLTVPNFEQHRQYFQNTFSKAVTIFKTILLIAQGKDHQDLLKQADEELLEKECFNEEDTLICDFYGRGRNFNREEQIGKIHRALADFKIKGKIDFKHPKLRYQLIECHEWFQGHHKTPSEQTLRQVYFGLELSCNKVGTAKFNQPFELSKRIYLGPTTADNDLAFLMCNQALVSVNSTVLDPFTGTGGLLIPPASKGAIVFGCDLDTRVLNGYAVGRINKRSPFYSAEKKLEIFTPKITLNFQQYGLPYPNIIRIDSTTMKMRAQRFFDVIIADPPYGIRAMSRSVTARKGEEEVKPQTVELQKDEEEEQITELSEEQVIAKEKKRQKKRVLRENKKKRRTELPEQERQFKQQLLLKLDKQRVENWQKFERGKIETTQREVIFAGLLGIAERYLTANGRLVFLYPVYEDEQYKGIGNLPPHQGFKVVDLSRNMMSQGNSRVLVTMEKSSQ